MDADLFLKFIRLTYTGLSEGALLGLIALGLVLVFKSSDVINFAHGEFMLLSAYVVYQVMLWLQGAGVTDLLLPIALLIGVLAMVGLGVLVERLILRPLIGEPVISVIMVTIGLTNILQAIVGAVWGVNPQSLPTPILPIEGRFEFVLEGARRPLFLPYEGVFMVVIVLLLVGFLTLFFRRSKYGIAMRAAADDQQAAMSMGISIKTVFAFAWSLAAIIAGVAGLLIANLTNNVSGDIDNVGLRAFPVIILGGLDSIPGAIIGGFIVGLIESYASGYIDPSVKNVIPYVVLLVILMIKPYGLFGQKRIERV